MTTESPIPLAYSATTEHPMLRRLLRTVLVAGIAYYILMFGTQAFTVWQSLRDIGWGLNLDTAFSIIFGATSIACAVGLVLMLMKLRWARRLVLVAAVANAIVCIVDVGRPFFEDQQMNSFYTGEIQFMVALSASVYLVMPLMLIGVTTIRGIDTVLE